LSVAKLSVKESSVRTGIFAAIAAIAIGCSATASAADLPYNSQPYTVTQPLNMYSWAGPYVGGNLGYEWGSVSNSNTEPHGIQGGIQGGYNWQYGQFVVGGEIDFQGSGADDRFASWKFSNPFFGTVRGRVGYAMNNVLIFATGGLAYGTVRAQIGGFTESRTSTGWTIGAGAEVGLTQNWSVKAEYLYVDLSDNRFAITGLPHAYAGSVFRLGVNYRF
jgi:outer membrane immunogenic protein